MYVNLIYHKYKFYFKKNILSQFAYKMYNTICRENNQNFCNIFKLEFTLDFTLLDVN